METSDVFTEKKKRKRKRRRAKEKVVGLKKEERGEREKESKTEGDERKGGKDQGKTSSESMNAPRAPVERQGAEKEVYGFVCWIGTIIAYCFFLLWAFLPEDYLEHFGITYYPSKYWAIAAPAWICMTVLFIAFLYISWNMYNTPPLESPDTYTDSRSGHFVPNNPFSYPSEDNVPPVTDIPLDIYCQIMYDNK